jgi:hypothetical protein
LLVRIYRAIAEHPDTGADAGGRYERQIARMTVDLLET